MGINVFPFKVSALSQVIIHHFADEWTSFHQQM